MRIIKSWIIIFRLLVIGLLMAGRAQQKVMADPGSAEGSNLASPILVLEEAKNLALVSHLDGTFLELQVVDDLVYAAKAWDFMQIIDVSDPSQPAVAWTVPAEAYSVAVENQIAYIADFSSGLYLFDVSDPSQPEQLGLYQSCFSHSIWCDEINYKHVYVNEEIAYLSISVPEITWCFECGPIHFLYILDISDPANPVFLNSIPTSKLVRGITIRDGIAFFVDGNLHILDISDPAYPAEFGYLDTNGIASDIVLAGNIAYIGNYLGGLFSIDVSNPAHPVQIGSFSPPLVSNPDNNPYVEPPIFNTIEIKEDLAYISDWHYGLRVFYIQDPEHPGMVGRYPAAGNTFYSALTRVALEGDLIFLAHDGGGLEILMYTGPEVFNQATGQVTDIVGKPVSGVAVSDGEGHLDFTGIDGTYTLSGLEAGSHTFKPSKIGFTFTPTERTAMVPPSATGQDFVGERRWIFLPFAVKLPNP